MLRPSDIPQGLDGFYQFDTTSLHTLTGALRLVDLQVQLKTRRFHRLPLAAQQTDQAVDTLFT